MIETGAGLAFLGVCIAAVVPMAKVIPGRARNGYVSEKTCKAVHDALGKQVEALFQEQRHTREAVEQLAVKIAGLRRED